MGVKHATDSTDRWWQAGPVYIHSKDGQLRHVRLADPLTNVLVDSLYTMDKKGRIRIIHTFSDTCTTFLFAPTSVNEGKDTLMAHFPNHSLVRKYKYKKGHLVSIKATRKTFEPNVVRLHGIQTSYDFKKNTITFSEYANDTLISVWTQEMPPDL